MRVLNASSVCVFQILRLISRVIVINYNCLIKRYGVHLNNKDFMPDVYVLAPSLLFWGAATCTRLHPHNRLVVI